MGVTLSSNNFNGATATVTLYLPTGTTIPYTSATAENLGSQTMPFTYTGTYPSWEHGVFSLFFSASGKTCIDFISTPPDGDGNEYRTILIGNQIWMSENLRTKKYQDGTDLSNTSAVNDATWISANGSTTKYWASVNGNAANDAIYGLLYNQFAISGSTSGATGSNQICPSGYRVPTQTDFDVLVNYLGGNSAAGGPLKYPGTTYFNTPNTDATNASGFSALGAGRRSDVTGAYTQFNLNGEYWSTTLISSSFYYLETNYNTANAFYQFATDRKRGLSVRCLKN
jgi:uncharacterized protein (TIGR02145 family)